MTSKNYMKVLAGSFIVGVAISTMACGSSSGSGSATSSVAAASTSTTIGSANCASGYFNVSGLSSSSCSYAPSGTFDSACAYAGGVVVTSEINNGNDVCETRTPIMLDVEFAEIPILTSGFPSNAQAYTDYRYSVYSGDSLLVQANSSGWGTYGPSGLFGLETSCTPSTSTAEADALNVSDGVGVYPLGISNGNIIHIQAQGNLFYGFNTTVTNGCSQLALELELVRCLDSNGNVWACPSVVL